MTRSTVVPRVVKLALSVALIAIAPGLLSAQPTCNPFDLHGAYAVLANGSMAGPSGISQITIVGVESFDGAGNTKITETASFGGMIVRTLLLGKYTIKPDCTGSITGTFPDGSVGHLDFVVADNWKTIYFMESDDGVNLSGTMTRQ